MEIAAEIPSRKKPTEGALWTCRERMTKFDTGWIDRQIHKCQVKDLRFTAKSQMQKKKEKKKEKTKNKGK